MTVSSSLLLTVVYATVTGNSKEVAKRIESEAKSKDIPISVSVTSVADVDVDTLPLSSHLVYVTSTYGDGEHPEDAEDFWEWLEDGDRPSTLFANSHIGVFGLGDSSFSMFCESAVQVDERLRDLGATPLLPLGMGDEDHEEGIEAALALWLEGLWQALGAKDKGGDDTPDAVFSCTPCEAPSVDAPPPGYEYVQLTHSEVITPATATERPAYMFHMDLGQTSLEYETGYHLRILPRMPDTAVQCLAKRLDLDLDSYITVQATSTTAVPEGLSEPHTLRDVLGLYLDIAAPVTKSFLKGLIPFASDATEKDTLMHMASKEGAERFHTEIIEESVQCFELCRMFPSVSVPLEHLIELVPANRARLYSIASSPLLHPREVQLVVRTLGWETPSGKVKQGLCTGYLADLKVEDNPMLAVQITPSPLQPPPDPMTPMALVGLGCGVAPFRAFMQHRQALHQEGVQQGACTMYFGSRKRAEDALCIDEFEAWEKQGLLRYVTAFSRDQPQKIYVTHRMKEDAANLWKGLGEEDGFFGYCGPSGRTPQDITAIIKGALVSEGGLSEGEAEERYRHLSDRGLMVLEAW
ncbi:flavodoxin [Kipferlia bialata]|uniref:NADPH--hemoprotein reductase n=1 Tax=Kipferlia bialata TaxID=797122 RepID=A0A9K3CW59_9EUKA|nr:flavodoxin [Kipferlia bialata]|eukprot:g5764.t1